MSKTTLIHLKTDTILNTGLVYHYKEYKIIIRYFAVTCVSCVRCNLILPPCLMVWLCAFLQKPDKLMSPDVLLHSIKLLLVIWFFSYWKVHVKAGKHGWGKLGMCTKMVNHWWWVIFYIRLNFDLHFWVGSRFHSSMNS